MEVTIVLLIFIIFIRITTGRAFTKKKKSFSQAEATSTLNNQKYLLVR